MQIFRVAKIRITLKKSKKMQIKKTLVPFGAPPSSTLQPHIFCCGHRLFRCARAISRSELSISRSEKRRRTNVRKSAHYRE